MHSRHHDCRAAAEAFLVVFCAVAELDMNSWREVLQSNLVDNIRNFLPSSSSLLMSSGRSLSWRRGRMHMNVMWDEASEAEALRHERGGTPYGFIICRLWCYSTLPSLLPNVHIVHYPRPRAHDHHGAPPPATHT
jgi:hypothetical protein